jgi:hypothetical protein
MTLTKAETFTPKRRRKTMPTKTKIELKRCPFCGSECGIGEYDNVGKLRQVYIYCFKDEEHNSKIFRGEDYDTICEQAVSHWNTRYYEAPTGTTQELIEHVSDFIMFHNLPTSEWYKAHKNTADLLTECKDQLLQQHQELSKLFTENDTLGFANTQLSMHLVKKDAELKHLREGIEKIQSIAKKNFVIGSYEIREITEQLQRGSGC